MATKLILHKTTTKATKTQYLKTFRLYFRLGHRSDLLENLHSGAVGHYKKYTKGFFGVN